MNRVRGAVAGVMAAGLCAIPPAHAASATTLYMSVLGKCGSGAVRALTRSAAGSDCTDIPRVMVEGLGVALPPEEWATERMPQLRIDASRKLTGVLAISLPAATEQGPVGAETAGYVAVDAVITIGHTRVGLVHVEGPVAPTKPAMTSFSLPLPPSLMNQRTSIVGIEVHYTTCVGAAPGCGVETGGGGGVHSHLVIPTK